MWTDWQFWRDSTWRAFRTFCQTLGALVGGAAFNLLTADWISMLSVSATASLVSLLQSIDRGRAVTEAAPPSLKPEVLDYSQWQPAPPVYGCGDSLR